jgi:hypothetical protein
VAQASPRELPCGYVPMVTCKTGFPQVRLSKILAAQPTSPCQRLTKFSQAPNSGARGREGGDAEGTLGTDGS